MSRNKTATNNCHRYSRYYKVLTKHFSHRRVCTKLAVNTEICLCIAPVTNLELAKPRTVFNTTATADNTPLYSYFIRNF